MLEESGSVTLAGPRNWQAGSPAVAAQRGVRSIQIPRRFVAAEWGGTETTILQSSRALNAAGQPKNVMITVINIAQLYCRRKAKQCAKARKNKKRRLSAAFF